MNSQWLKTQFSLNPHKTKAGLAKTLGMEPPAVSKILSGKRQIKAHEYIAMRKFFGLPSDGARAARPMDSYVLAPLGQGKGGGLQETSYAPEQEWVIPASVITAHTDSQAEKLKVFMVQENAMEPDFKKGEPVVVDTGDKSPSPPGVFIVSDGFGYLLRQCEFVPNSSPPKICISARSENFQQQILKTGEFTVLGRVIAKLQWL